MTAHPLTLARADARRLHRHRARAVRPRARRPASGGRRALARGGRCARARAGHTRRRCRSRYEVVSTPEQIDEVRAECASSIWPTAIQAPSPAARSRPTSGRVAGETLANMIDLALDGRLDGIMFRAAEQGGVACGRLALQRRAPDVRAPDAPPGFFRRDERARQPVDVARDLARRAANRARPDHARAHRCKR